MILMLRRSFSYIDFVLRRFFKLFIRMSLFLSRLGHQKLTIWHEMSNGILLGIKEVAMLR